MDKKHKPYSHFKYYFSRNSWKIPQIKMVLRTNTGKEV